MRKYIFKASNASKEMYHKIETNDDGDISMKHVVIHIKGDHCTVAELQLSTGCQKCRQTLSTKFTHSIWTVLSFLIAKYVSSFKQLN